MMYHIENRTGLPDTMQTLLGDYPREAWPDHPNFARSIQNWMGAHQMFRQLAEITQSDTESFLNKNMNQQDYTGRLAHFGNQLVRNLHGHHSWEDRSFFPELGAAENSLEHGLMMLEGDHVELDRVLDSFTRGANRVIKLADLDPTQMPEEAARMHDHSTAIGRFLARHLADEEDLVVPIILHHKLRG